MSEHGEEFERFIAQVRADAAREALTDAADEVEAEQVADELAMNDKLTVDSLPMLSQVMLNGGERFAERLRARAAALTPTTETEGERS